MSEGYEKKDVSIKALFIGTFATVFLILIFIVGLRDYFIFNIEKSITAEIINNPNIELIEIIKKDKAMLNGYGVIDKEKGVYKIPIEQAMKTVIRDYSK